MSVWLTIPTRGDRPSLHAIIEDCGLPRERIVLVHTSADSPDIEGCLNLRDLGEVNIQRWWNVGIEAAAARGATVVVVANDDIIIGDPEAITRLAEAAAPLAYVGPGRRGPLQMTGWCWAIRPQDTDLRLDEGFRWYYGEDDLELRAKAANTPLVDVEVDITHLSLGHIDERLKPLIAMDMRRFTALHLVK